jgi:hypothetical protein
MFDEDGVINVSGSPESNRLFSIMNRAFDFILDKYYQDIVTDKQAKVFLSIVNIIVIRRDYNNYEKIFEIFMTVYVDTPENLFNVMIENAANENDTDYLISIFVGAFTSETIDKYRLIGEA